MLDLQSTLFSRLITRNLEVYMLKVITIAIAFASSLLVILFALNEFGYDRFHRGADRIFRVLERNTDEPYSGNRLSAKVPYTVFERLRRMSDDSLVVSRVKTMNDVSVISNRGNHRGQTLHAADPEITRIFTFDFVDGDAQSFRQSDVPAILLSSSAAKKYTGRIHAAGARLSLSTYEDTVQVVVAAVFRDFPVNAHEDHSAFLIYDHSAIASLNFISDETGIYGKMLSGEAVRFHTWVNTNAQTNRVYSFQPLPQIYFGPRVLGEGARHGDRYSVIILLSMAGLILFLAVSGFINLTTLTLPHRSKELAVKKLAGVSREELLLAFLKESFALTTVSLLIALVTLVAAGTYIESILRLPVRSLIINLDSRLLTIAAVLSIVMAVPPVFMTWRFVQSTPNRLLSTDTISFPVFKRIISLVQLGLSISLIISSLVIRRQIDYSLIKEPGQNHDQVVYLNCPDGITNEGLHALRSGWKKYNPNILDVMAVSQLPDRISSREPGSDFYMLKVDPGFRDFFGLKMITGNWFRVNAGDSIIVTNKSGRARMGNMTSNVIGVVQDVNGLFNRPEKPVKIQLAQDFNYNWLCVRVLEVDIRRTIRRLSESFSTAEAKAHVRFLDKHFENWIGYQDRLNFLSGILTVIAALLSCFAIYGLSVCMVRDKLKQIAIHKLHGAGMLHVTRILVKEFAKEMMLGLFVFTPLTYILLNELLRSFVYSTEFSWTDPLYPAAYCVIVIIAVCGFQALSLNRSDLTSALKA